MARNDAVHDYLSARGCALHVVEEGLEGLMRGWEKTVESVINGYGLGLDDYLNDLDGRQILEDTLEIAPPEERESCLERLHRADERMKSLVLPAGECLWGDDTAREKGWTADRNWWYFVKPREAGPELWDEIENG
jgi:hypothetical protein